MGDAAPLQRPPSGPGENWLRAAGLALLGGVIVLDAFIEGFDPSPAFYVPLLSGAIAGNEIWAWATRKSQPPKES